MKDKDKTAQKKKSAGSKGAPGAKRTVSGGGACPTSAPIEARFQAVFESSRDAIGVSRAGVHVFANPAYLELFGFPEGTSLAGKPVLDLIAPGSRDQIRAYMVRRSRDEAAPSTYETRGMRTDGSEFDMEVSVSTYHENGEEHTLVILRDITRRKMAEEEISERGAVLQQIMDTASVAIFLLDRSGRIVHANRRMAEMLGCDLTMIVGSEYVDHVHPSERETSRRKMLALLASEIPSVDLERLYWRKDGTQFWGHLDGRRFHDVHGNEVGLIGVIADISVRKQAEEALRNNEGRLNTILDNVGAHIFIKDTRYRYTYVNRKTCELFGKGAQEITGKSDKEFFSAESVEEIMRSDRPVIEHGETVTREEAVLTSSDKVPRTYWTVKLPLRDSKGTVTGLYGISTDITLLKQAEEQVRASEKKFSVIFGLIPDPTTITDIETGRIIDLNDAAAQWFGRSREEAIGMTTAEAQVWEDPSDRERMLHEIRSKGEINDMAFHLRKHTGETRSVLFSSRIIEFGGKRCLLSRVHDITEAKRLDEALLANEALLMSVMESSADAIFVKDLQGRYVLMNSACSALIGKRSEDILGKDDTAVFPPSEASRIMEQDKGLISSKSSIMYEHVLTMAGGKRMLQARKGPVIDQQGRVSGVYGISRDITERKRSEDALKESEERFKAITTTASDAILLMDDKGRIVYWNPAAGRMFGHSSEESLGKDLHLFLGPERLHGNFQRGFGNFVKTGQGPVINKSVELVAHRKDGTEFPIEISTSAMNIGDRWHALGIVRDITERKRAEQEIREKEGKYRVLFEAAKDGIFIQDATAFIDCNNKGAEMYGLPKEKIIGRSPIEFSPERQPDGRPSSAVAGEKIGAAFNGVPQVFEWQSLRADGSLFDVEVTLSRLELGGSLYLQSIVRDIGERKRAEHALRSSEARFRSIIEHASTGILVADSETAQIVYANPEICRMLGYSEQEFHALKATDLAVPEEASLSAAGFEAHAKGKIEATERTLRRKNGSFVRMSINSVPVEYDGRPCMVGFFMDITERRLLEDERLKTQKLESLGTLAGGIAHDFNNLLQGVFGYISMARLTFDQREKSLAMLEQAEKALHQSVNLTSQLLTFSKGGRPVKRVFALPPVIENSVKFALSGSRVTYEIAIDDGLRSVEADEGQIGQVIQNIVLNADQAMPLGGRIGVSLRNMPAAKITAPPAGLQGDLVEISIRDQGIGIPPEHLTRIFDPYFTTKEKGSGLGLATVYSIIKNHGGLVRVQSEAGKGTTFLIYLPASATPAEVPQSSVLSAAARKGRILVMDDEELIRLVAEELLTAMGHEVACAESGETALEAYQAARDAGRPFDVVILDLTIRGGMGGLETVRKLAEIDPGVRAVVSSGYSDDAVLSNYRDQGFQAFLKKPYDMDDLASTLNALLA
jgi:PAS domain S-box-containing protein